MRRLLLCLLVALATTFAAAGPTSAQTTPEFRLGFQSMAELIPEVVGQPLEEERFDPVAGVALQPTTAGLMVWRGDTNTTAFTDGSTTWLVGPLGLQIRPNDARFAWEGPDLMVSLPLGAVAVTCERALDGTWVASGTVHNPLAEPVHVEIDLLARVAAGSDSVDVPTLLVADLPPGGSRAVSVRIPTAELSGWQLLVVARPAVWQEALLLDLGTTRPLNLSSSLLGAAELLRGVEGGEWLLRVAAENGVVVRSAPTPANILGIFDGSRGLAIVSSRLNLYSARVRAAVLAHELQHAADAAAGLLPAQNPTQCLDIEARAFGRQAEIWSGLWEGNLPPPTNSVVTELNDVTSTIATDPQAFVRELVRRYGSDCGLIP